jgi:hypothetical protein
MYSKILFHVFDFREIDGSDVDTDPDPGLTKSSYGSGSTCTFHTIPDPTKNFTKKCFHSGCIIESTTYEIERTLKIITIKTGRNHTGSRPGSPDPDPMISVFLTLCNVHFKILRMLLC